jgi:hypothetical protein
MPAATPVVLLLDLFPVIVDICITRRDSFVYGFLLEDADGPIDLTGGSFLHAVNPQDDGGGVDLFELPDFNTLDATGLVQFLPSVVDLTQVPAKYFHDIQWTNAASRVRTVIKGSYTIGKDISG